jgi:amino acid adenylation domain-containing protein
MRVSLSSLGADSRTLGNLIEEIARFYAASGGEEAPEEPIQYSHFCEWQAALLEDEEAGEGKRYWRQQAVSATPALALQFEAPFSGEEPPEFLIHCEKLDVELLDRIDAAAKRAGVTANVIMLACWQTLLWKLTGQPEITVGAIFDGRKFEELQGALGLLAKCLPVHLSFSGGLRFGEVLRQLHKSVQEAHRWQEYFDCENGAAGGDPLAGFIPFCFEFEQPPTDLRAGDLRFTTRRSYSCINRFKIKLACLRGHESGAAQFYFDPRLYSATQIRRVAGQYISLLASATDVQERAAGALEILAERERQEVLVDFNRTAAAYTPGLGAHELFERQVERTPDTTAVILGAEHLTYRELNERANRVGHYLMRLGVGPEIIVGICMRRSVEMIVGLLGVLKAGGGYLPLESTYPSERLRYMLTDAQARVVLTESVLAGALPSAGARQVRLDRDWEEIERESHDNPRVAVEAKNLAYVIYTSGSTGRPKGVMVEHGGLANYVNWAAEAYRLAESNGTLMHSPLGFDLTVTSLYPSLVTGQSIQLAPELKGVESLIELLREAKSHSLLKITPAHLDLMRMMMRPEEIARASGGFIIGGEALKDESLEYWREKAPRTRLINEYGPTETVVGCCVFDASATPESAEGGEGEKICADGARRKRAVAPIGRPIANMQVYAADDEMRAVASGVAGELYIGGAGVARGYLNRPDLTAERFLPNPWDAEGGAISGSGIPGSGVPGTRVYRTGDLVMHIGDEGIEFLGRIDEQVKIHGYRIELAEIEAILNERQGVKQCKVIMLQESDGEKRLAAYIVCDEERDGAEEKLISHLREVLPEHMIPARFIMLDSLPLTPNGKIDLRALPPPSNTIAQNGANYMAPSTPVEETLARMWADVLNLERVGVNDDFFLRGGHSLLGIQFVARLRETFQTDLEPSALFEAPTVEKLAKVLVEREAKPGQTEKIALILKKLDSMTDEDAGAELAARR